METLWFELGVVLLLILANGFFAGAELAIVSVRRGRIAQLVAEGHAGAKVLDGLQADPHRFLATVQIGVTLVGTLASAVGGAAAIEVIKPLLQQAPFELVRDGAEPLSLFLVVGCIAYLSLILGELVPKALALEYSERIALGVARPIHWLARWGGAAVFVLTLSSRTVLALLGVKGRGEQAFITKDEIQHLIAEGRESGSVSSDEQEFIRNVFEFSNTQVREVMVPRPRVVGLDLEFSREDVLARVLEHQYSRYPVYRGEIEAVVGFVHGKDLLAQAVRSTSFDLQGLMRPCFFVPETKRVNELLREMQRKHLHMAMVVDEYGSLSGVVTTEDLLEELVGEIEDEHDADEPRRIQPLDNGGYLVDALIPLKELEVLLGVRCAPGQPFDTLAGLILFKLGHLPVEGEHADWGAFRLTCVKVKGTAIRRVRIDLRGDDGA